MGTTRNTSNINRSLGNGPKGMAVIWSNEDRAQTMYCVTPLNPKLPWKSLSLISKLGVMNIQYAKPDKRYRGGVPDITNIRNITLELFTMDCDPASTSFGVPGYAAQGTVLLRRSSDKSDLTVPKSVIEPLELFIQDRLAAIKSALHDRDAAKLQYEQLNPKAFKKFYKIFRGNQDKKYPGYGWEKVVCPVELDTVACEGCGADEAVAVEGETDSTLKKCGKCLVVRYCSRECQTGDWKAHKAFCKSGAK